jgi:hypothetical protein
MIEKASSSGGAFRVSERPSRHDWAGLGIGSGHVIEIKLKTPEQLLDSFDPSPFHHRDLDDRAANYIIDSAEEHGSGEELRLVIELPADQVARDLTQDLPSALHNAFAYRARHARSEMRDLLRNGRLSLVIGLAVLCLCIALIQILGLSQRQSTLAQLTEQGLFILGWVAIWRPLEIFLYEWWPVKKRIDLLDRLSAAAVEVRAG